MAAIDLTLVSADALFIGFCILFGAWTNGFMRDSPPSNYGIQGQLMEVSKQLRMLRDTISHYMKRQP